MSHLYDSDPIAAPRLDDTVVGVRGSLTGSGTVVSIGKEIKIITNSHIVQDLDSVEVTIPGILRKSGATYKKTFRAKVEFPVAGNANAALSDIAVLAIPDNDPELTALLSALAQRTVRFKQRISDGDRFEIPHRYFESGDTIYSVIESIPRKTRAIAPWTAKEVPDHYISGFYDKIYVAPVYSRPGMSGGAYFAHGHYAGMVTKVDLGGSLNTYVIPVEEMAKVISSAYFGEKSTGSDSLMPRVSNSAWERDNRGDTSLKVKLENGTLLRSSSRSGRTGIAGGEGGSGGGEGGSGGGARNSRYWKLQVQMHGTSRSDRSEAEIANPFESGTRHLEVNGDQIAYIAKKDREGTEAFQVATIPRYLRLLNGKSGSYSAVKQSDEAAERLFRARIQGIGSPGFARSYKKMPGGRLDLVFGGYGTLQSDGAQSLFPWKDQLKTLAKAGTGPRYDGLFPNEPDEAGFYAGFPLSARNNGNFIDARFKDSSSDFSIVAPKDLTRIIIKDASNSAIDLKLVSRKDAPTLIFQSREGNYRAAVVFDEKSLAQMERAFLETPNHVIEFIGCEPGMECWR